MNCLNKLITFLNGIFLEKRDHFSAVAPTASEGVCHFIFAKDHLYSETKKAKPNAFKPHSKRMDLSVYRVDACSDSLIWHISRNYVEGLRPDKKPVIARADFKLELAIRHNLHLNPDGHPHKRHLNLERWPSTWKMIATDMANEAVTHQRP